MAPGAELAARPPRVPKLTYRNRLPADQSSLSSQNTAASEALTSDAPADQRLSTPTSTAPASSLRPSSDSSTSSSLASRDSNDSSSKDSKASKKKKANNVLSFLTLKEPSQLALEHYAESQRKQAAAKGGSITGTVGLQTVTTAKLPPGVPKVNSKWDGIPESAKSIRSSRDSMSSKKRDSSSSHGSQVMPSFSYNASKFSVATNATNVSYGPPPSLASAASSTSDLSQRRDSGLSVTPPLSSPSTTSLPEMTYFFPDNLNPTGSLPTSPAHPWSPPPLPSHAVLDPTSMHSAKHETVIVLEPELPAPSMDSKADAILKRLTESATRGFLAGEAQEVQVGEEEEDSDPVPETHDFLFQAPLGENCYVEPLPLSHSPVRSPPAVDRTPRKPSMNFSRPRQSPHYAHKQAVPSLPTLYEASIASTDTVTESSELERTTSNDSDTSSIAPSIASSVAPSVMSASWYRSSRDRLGLGGRIRKNDVLPWESQGEPPAECVVAETTSHTASERDGILSGEHTV